jgi:alkylation response protein AidB-like acyl-CoA dehydrogenase
MAPGRSVLIGPERSVSIASNTPDSIRWQGTLNERGWSVPHWPVEYGGTGWSPLQLFIFDEELHEADAPEFQWAATHMVGPIIYLFGSEAQKRRFLPDIRQGAYLWAQGFSEPGAGSDLVALQTTAKLEGDRYRVNGQKIWTSAAFEADWGFFLVKTDTSVKPQRGISFLLIDLKSPGITIRRIPQLNGDAHICEVFLDDVSVPKEDLVGEPGLGWKYAKTLLDQERTASSYVHFNKRELRRAKEIAHLEDEQGASLAQEPQFRHRIARLDAQVSALQWSVLRVLAQESSRYGATAAASMLKIRGARLQQAITELQIDLIGARALRFYEPEGTHFESDDFWRSYIPGRTSAALIARAVTIFGGTEQVQKNILSKLAFDF